MGPRYAALVPCLPMRTPRAMAGANSTKSRGDAPNTAQTESQNKTYGFNNFRVSKCKRHRNGFLRFEDKEAVCAMLLSELAEPEPAK